MDSGAPGKVDSTSTCCVPGPCDSSGAQGSCVLISWPTPQPCRQGPPGPHGQSFQVADGPEGRRSLCHGCCCQSLGEGLGLPRVVELSRWRAAGGRKRDTKRHREKERQTEAGRQRQRERVARVRNPEKERVGTERGGVDGGRDDGLGGRWGGWAGRLNPSRCPDVVWGPRCHSGEGTYARLGLPGEGDNLLRASDLASQGQSQAAGPRPSQAVPGMVWVVLPGWGGWPQILQLLPGWQTPRVCHRAPNQTSQSWQGSRAYLAAFRGLWARRLGPFKPLPLALPGPAWGSAPHPCPSRGIRFLLGSKAFWPYKAACGHLLEELQSPHPAGTGARPGPQGPGGKGLLQVSPEREGGSGTTQVPTCHPLLLCWRPPAPHLLPPGLPSPQYRAGRW